MGGRLFRFLKFTAVLNSGSSVRDGDLLVDTQAAGPSAVEGVESAAGGKSTEHIAACSGDSNLDTKSGFPFRGSAPFDTRIHPGMDSNHELDKIFKARN